MEIYTTHGLISWYEFLRQCEAAFKVPREDFDGRTSNRTMQEFPGRTLILYEAEHGDVSIQYLQTREWLYERRGIVGVGLTFDSALAVCGTWFDADGKLVPPI